VWFWSESSCVLIDEFGSIAFTFASGGGWLVFSIAISETIV